MDEFYVKLIYAVLGAIIGAFAGLLLFIYIIFKPISIVFDNYIDKMLWRR